VLYRCTRLGRYRLDRLARNAKHFLDIEAVRQYQLYLLNERKLSPETINQYISSVKFLYLTTLEMPWTDEYFPRVRRSHKLPIVLSQEEVLAFFDHVPSLKYRAVRPQGDYLFPSWRKDHHLCTTSLQLACREAALRAGIHKRVTVHSLRHAFATPLLENGAGIRIIQVLRAHVDAQLNNCKGGAGNRPRQGI
jgi:site-specific recombinase XerD